MRSEFLVDLIGQDFKGFADLVRQTVAPDGCTSSGCQRLEWSDVERGQCLVPIWRTLADPLMLSGRSLRYTSLSVYLGYGLLMLFYVVYCRRL